MIKLLEIDDLTASDIFAIWQMVEDRPKQMLRGDVAWSFEGNGIRTRTTFLRAFQNLGLNYIELPNFLKTGESAVDLAGYMDPFYSLYVIREGNHRRLAEFAQATSRPVINAMSAEAHPCEVLTDAYFLHKNFESIQSVRTLLWGPVTNVFKSWYALADVLGLDVTHFAPVQDQTKYNHIDFALKLEGTFDVIVTDGWPAGFSDSAFTLSEAILNQLGNPILLPTPPVTIGNELDSPISQVSHFVGYAQKELLLPVQEAIIQYLI